MSDLIETLKSAKSLIVMDMLRSAIQAIDTVIEALQSGEPVALERVEAHLEIVHDEVSVVIEPDPEGSLVYYDNVVRAMQSAPQPVVAVNQQLVEALKHIMKMQTFGYIVLGEEATTKARKALLSAGKEKNNE